MLMGTGARICCEKFLAHFPNREACYRYLAGLKARRGYRCLKCAHTGCCKGRTRYHRRCRLCGYDESPATGTLFAGMHLPIHTAFYLLYKFRTATRRVSCQQLSGILGLQPKTVRRFRQLIMGSLGIAAATGPLPGELDFLQGIV